MNRPFSRAYFTELRALRSERGATDPILIIAGIAITLILLVGGTFAISGFINNARDLNAKGDLDRIAVAQAAYMAENGDFLTYRSNIRVGTPDTRMEGTSLGFVPTEGSPLIVAKWGSVGAKNARWAAMTKSASGEVFVRLSASTQAYPLGSSYALDQSTLAPEIRAEIAKSNATAWVTDAYVRVQGR